MNERRFHIGEQQLLAPSRLPLRDHIHRRAVERDTGDGISLIGVEMGKTDIAGAARRQPVGPFDIGTKGMQALADRNHGLLVKNVILRPGDQRENVVRHQELPRLGFDNGPRLTRPGHERQPRSCGNAEASNGKPACLPTQKGREDQFPPNRTNPNEGFLTQRLSQRPYDANRRIRQARPRWTRTFRYRREAEQRSPKI